MNDPALMYFIGGFIDVERTTDQIKGFNYFPKTFLS
jgi:hypothetical protein